MYVDIQRKGGGGHRSVSRGRKAHLLLIACDAIDGAKGWERDRRGKKESWLVVEALFVCSERQ